MTGVSVIIPTMNEGEHLRRTYYQLCATVPTGTEVIVVDDGATDGCCDFLRNGAESARLLDYSGVRLGVSSARNRGAKAAHGETLVFLDAHVELPPGWIEALQDAASAPQVGAAAPAISALGRPDCCSWGMRYRDAELDIEWLPRPTGTEPAAVPMVPGCCIAMRRAVFEAVGGFDPGLRQWGSEDNELCLRLWTAGYEVRIAPDVTVAHLFRPRHPYRVDWSAVLHNKMRVAFVHFGPARIARVIERLKRFDDFAAACALIAASDVSERRGAVHAARQTDDDAFFTRFGELQ